MSRNHPIDDELATGSVDSHPAARALAALTMPSIPPLGSRRAAFLGCGDSLAAARPAELEGHRVLSAGDVAWGGGAPRGVDVVVPLSWSGRTGATIRAAQIAREAGLPVIAVTTNTDSPLAELADEVVLVPSFDQAEEIPALGYAVHSAAAAALVAGHEIDLAEIAAAWASSAESTARIVADAGPIPHGMTVATFADAHGAGEFWMLKLIEATGIAVRTTGVEEIGHVDYFLGPQQQLSILMSGESEAPRADALGRALARNGQHVLHIRLADLAPTICTTGLDTWSRQVLGGLVGAEVSGALGRAWGRPAFRGGQVDLTASHIQVPAA